MTFYSMRAFTMLFRDRLDAGLRLAAQLQAYRGAPDTVVLGIPRGGIVVAAAIAHALDLPLGICPVRKVGAPGNPELAIGAVDDESGLIVDYELVHRFGLSEAALQGEAARQRRELRHWVAQAEAAAAQAVRRGDHETAILVDDGIATGSTAEAAIGALRRRGARRVVLAVPVAPKESIERLRLLVDECVCLATPDPFYAVGNFFDHWPQVTDAEVFALLRVTGPESGASSV